MMRFFVENFESRVTLSQSVVQSVLGTNPIELSFARRATTDVVRYPFNIYNKYQGVTSRATITNESGRSVPAVDVSGLYDYSTIRIDVSKRSDGSFRGTLYWGSKYSLWSQVPLRGAASGNSLTFRGIYDQANHGITFSHTEIRIKTVASQNGKSASGSVYVYQDSISGGSATTTAQVALRGSR